MSVYKTIKSQFANPASLIRALADAGLRFEQSSDLRVNTLTLQTHWAGHGSQDHPVAIAIQKEQLRDKIACYDGMGFQWAGDHYELIYDRGDEWRLVNLLNQLRQRYAYHEVQQAFHARGWVVGDTSQVGDDLNITFRQYTGTGGY